MYGIKNIHNVKGANFPGRIATRKPLLRRGKPTKTFPVGKYNDWTIQHCGLMSRSVNYLVNTAEYLLSV